MLSDLLSFSGRMAAAGKTRQRRFVFACAVLSLSVYGANGALGQPAATHAAAGPAKDGIWFQVKAAIKPVPQPQEQGSGKTEPRAALSVQLRISSHAEGSNYYGRPTQKFDFKLAEGSEEKLYWQDAACHPRRGIPKISVIAVDGVIERDGRSEDVKARPRQLGTKLPADEISPGSRLAKAPGNERPALTFQASTGASKLDVLVKLYTVNCAL